MALPLLLDVPKADLPEDWRRLLDPAVPLAEPRHLIADGMEEPGGMGILLVLSVPLTVALGAVTLVNLGRLLLGQDVSSAALGTGPVLTLVGAALSAWAARRFLRARQQRRAVQAGRWRTGLFVQPEALLFHYEDRCWLVPRWLCRSVVTERDGSYDARVATWWMVHETLDGQESRIQLPPQVVNGTELTRWIATGSYPG